MGNTLSTFFNNPVLRKNLSESFSKYLIPALFATAGTATGAYGIANSIKRVGETPETRRKRIIRSVLFPTSLVGLGSLGLMGANALYNTDPTTYEITENKLNNNEKLLDAAATIEAAKQLAEERGYDSGDSLIGPLGWSGAAIGGGYGGYKGFTAPVSRMAVAELLAKQKSGSIPTTAQFNKFYKILQRDAGLNHKMTQGFSLLHPTRNSGAIRLPRAAGKGVLGALAGLIAGSVADYGLDKAKESL